MRRRSPKTLHYPAWRGKLELVRSLIAAGETVDQLDYDGFTPLCRAANGGHPQVVQFLLELGADPDGLTTNDKPDGNNNREDSFNSDEVEGAEEGEKTVPCGVPLSESMKAKNRIAAVEVVRLLITAGANVNARGQYLRTPLLAAAWNQWPEMVDTLLAAGANPNFADDSETTPLLAALSGEEDRDAVERIVQSLLRGGANSHLADFEGQTPLMLAAAYGYVGLVQSLLEMGGDVNAVDCERRNALARASESLANLTEIRSPGPAWWMFVGNVSQEQINELRATAIPCLNRIVDMLINRGSSMEKAACYLVKAGRGDLLK